MFKSTLFKIGILFFMMDTFIRRPFHLEQYLGQVGKEALVTPALPMGTHGLSCPGHEAVIVMPYFWVLLCYGIAFVFLTVCLMIHESSSQRIKMQEKEDELKYAKS